MNKKLKSIFAMMFIIGGTLIIKGGALLFGFRTYLAAIGVEKTVIWLGSLIAFLSAIYVITFTRGNTLWKGIFSDNNRRLLENKYSKQKATQIYRVGVFSGCIAIISGIGLIPILSYIGTNEILHFLHISNRIVFYLLLFYCLISDYIAYLSFTTRITIESTKKFYNDLFLEKNKFTKAILLKTLIITSLGFLSNMSFNYFLARSALSIAFKNFILITVIASLIAVISAIVTFLSKSGNVYHLISTQNRNKIGVLCSSDKIKFYSHKIVGFCYLLCFCLSYYIACIKNCQYLGINLHNEKILLTIKIVSILTALSAVYMEYSLSYFEMMKEFSNRVLLKANVKKVVNEIF